MSQKAADLNPGTQLQPQQERVVQRLDQEPGLLVYHGLGAGKSLASIAAAEHVGGQKNVIVPAALRENYRKEIRNFVRNPQGYHIQSYNEYMRKKQPPANVSILDEAQRVGRPDSGLSAIHKKLTGKKVLLSATPIRNEPSEMVPLLKIIAPDRPIPRTAEEFDKRFIIDRPVSPGFMGWLRGVKPGVRQELGNRGELRDLLRGRVDYHPSKGEFPTVANEDIEVPMTKDQHRLYKGLMGRNSALAYKVRSNLPPNKQEAGQLNAFLSGVRQVSNNPASYDARMTGDPVQHSPKMQRMLEELRKRTGNPNFKALVYSNYLDSGVKPLSAALSQSGVPNGVFHGGLNDAARKQLIDKYNANKLRALLISGAGAEGLDLKGTRLVQLMEPHWNDARLEQVVGRAVRHRSHAHLSPEERNVLVQRFYSSPRQGVLARMGIKEKDLGADRYMANLSAEKQRLNNQMLKVLQAAGSEKVPEKKAALQPMRTLEGHDVPTREHASHTGYVWPKDLPNEEGWTQPSMKQHGVILKGKATSSAALAHELGHASGKPVPGQSLGRGTAGALLPLGAGGLAGLATKSHLGAAGLGALAGVVTHAPTLLEEARASRNAIKIMRNAGTDEETIARAKRKLLLAYGAYLAVPAISGAAMGTTAHLLRRWAKKKYG